MMLARSGISAGLLIAVFVASSLGCASMMGTPKQIGPNDMAMLAGKWSGMFSAPWGQAIPGTIDIMPNGTYTARGGAFLAEGKATIEDGNLTLVPTMTTGVPTRPRGSSASLTERSGGTLVLSGYGHSDRGPYNFEVTKQK